MKKFKLSIIIPTWNRKKKLIKLLKNILPKLEKTDIKYQIHICDSYSSDGTQIDLQNLYGRNRKILFHNIKINNISRKRNEGLKNAKFANILFLDDDCLPIGDFFNIIKKYLQNSSNKQIFCGQYLTQKKLVRRSNYYKFRDSKNLNYEDVGEINYNNIITGCCFFKLSQTKKLYYFNNKINGYGLEDVDWAYRLTKKNFNLFLTEAKVDHQETSKNITAYVLKWYALSKDAMPSLLKSNKKNIEGRIFFFEKLYQYPLIKLILKILNFFVFIPVSIILKYFLLFSDKKNFLFSTNLFIFLLALYYLRGACDRDKVNSIDTKWYNTGYK